MIKSLFKFNLKRLVLTLLLFIFIMPGMSRIANAETVPAVESGGIEIPQTTTSSRPTNGLVSWWSGHGNAKDRLNINNGILKGGVSFRSGIVGQAFSFDGIDDYVEVPHSPSLDITGAITMEAWFKANANTSAMIMLKGDSGGMQNTTSYGLQIGDWDTTSGKVVVVQYGGYPNDWFITTDSLIRTNCWYHIVATWDGTTDHSNNVKLYINGALVQSWTKVHPLRSTTQSLTIGSMKPPTYYHKTSGLIDEVAIYNRALSADEIQAIYTASSTGKERCETGGSAPPYLRVIDTINTKNNTLVVNSITPAPDSVTLNGDNTYIEWQYDKFLPGQLENLTFNVALKDPVSGENRLVNHKLEVIYTDINGNEVRTELPASYVKVSDSAFDGSVATDKLNYQANENVSINATIKSKSAYARTIGAKILIEDSQGVLVTQAADLPGLNFAADETKNFNNITFNTGTIYAGNYRAHLVIYDNQTKVDESLANFAIQQPAGAASISSKVAIDKMTYNPNEAVTITSTVQSTSANVILNNLTAQITIISSGGTVLFTDAKTIPILTTGQITQLTSYWNTSATTPGNYTVRLDVYNGVNLLSTSVSGFAISGTNTGSSAQGLQGTISATPNSIYQGKEISLGYTVTNSGNENIPALNIKIIIVDPKTQEVKAELNDQQAIPQGTSVIGVGLNSVSTSALIPGTYIAILRVATLAMAEFKTLSSANFEVKAGLEVTKKIPDTSSVLVWINTNCNQVKNDEKNVIACCSPNGSTCTRIDLLERMLKTASIQYQIVYTKDEFQRYLRNSCFTDYLILGDHQPLEDHHAYELRELVNSGKGLISSLFVDKGVPNTPLTGLKVSGYLPTMSRNINLVNSPIASSSTFVSEGKAAKAAVLTGTTVAGWISAENLPAVVLNDYGIGRSIYYAFDMGATLNDQNYEQLASLITNSITYVHKPLIEDSFMPDQLVPVEVIIKSLGGIFDLKIKETYPSQVKIYDPITSLWITENPWMKDIHVETNETKYLRYYALTPDISGVYTLNTELGYMENDILKLYKAVDTQITVGSGSAVYTGDVITALKALVVSNKERAKVSNAIRYMEQVRTRESSNTGTAFENNIQDILKAVESIMSVTSCDTTQIRLMMDMLLQIYQGKYYFW